MTRLAHKILIDFNCITSAKSAWWRTRDWDKWRIADDTWDWWWSTSRLLSIIELSTYRKKGFYPTRANKMQFFLQYSTVTGEVFIVESHWRKNEAIFSISVHILAAKRVFWSNLEKKLREITVRVLTMTMDSYLFRDYSTFATILLCKCRIIFFSYVISPLEIGYWIKISSSF